ncbi:dihydrodipicolinate synthase family protein [Piscinibacter sp. HJYY11]|uniref:dihydrodipicolinate synthase family protein n=1 Tax=Piscinibacter sp. HJYY11 TaxID=2801333 RepID=UPI00192024F7|nr:dihydrodipicolinate synthase family protein [Piscinibacter sp. HJYY11]MBL0729626.1 dihydrodipicolinate synthase family protein [Piscinibacter sp. HJYY11]
MQIRLPHADGGLADYVLKAQPIAPQGPTVKFNRTVYAAAHVVIDPVATADPWDASPVVDWESTLAFRAHLFKLGFKVAEAMDTAQRGMGVDWPVARDLIRYSARHAQSVGGEIACGVGTDQLTPGPDVTLADVEAAYREQLQVAEDEAVKVILMASRALARCATSTNDYVAVYRRLLRDVSQPVVLHWLGDMFDPALKGYWGASSLPRAIDAVAELIAENASKVDGIKVSLLDPKWELALREKLPPGVKMYTGDDFNYAELIAGDEAGYSHGLLGIFDPIAPVASVALGALAAGNTFLYREILDPTVALSREIFRAPTRHYKAGVVFLAWLNGHQDHFSMAGGLQSARGVLHYSKLFELADACGVLSDPELAVLRMRRFLAVAGGITS